MVELDASMDHTGVISHLVAMMILIIDELKIPK
jgi:hypothetical protein